MLLLWLVTSAGIFLENDDQLHNLSEIHSRITARTGFINRGQFFVCVYVQNFVGQTDMFKFPNAINFILYSYMKCSLR